MVTSKASQKPTLSSVSNLSQRFPRSRFLFSLHVLCPLYPSSLLSIHQIPTFFSLSIKQMLKFTPNIGQSTGILVEEWEEGQKDQEETRSQKKKTNRANYTEPESGGRGKWVSQRLKHQPSTMYILDLGSPLKCT